MNFAQFTNTANEELLVLVPIIWQSVSELDRIAANPESSQPFLSLSFPSRHQYQFILKSLLLWTVFFLRIFDISHSDFVFP